MSLTDESPRQAAKRIAGERPKPKFRFVDDLVALGGVRLLPTPPIVTRFDPLTRYALVLVKAETPECDEYTLERRPGASVALWAIFDCTGHGPQLANEELRIGGDRLHRHEGATHYASTLPAWRWCRDDRAALEAYQELTRHTQPTFIVGDPVR